MGKGRWGLSKIKGGTKISFDYATSFDSEMVDRTAPYVDYGFFSFKEKDYFVKEFLKDKVSKGMKIAIATFGEKGSLAWDEISFMNLEFSPAKVVNTIGRRSFIVDFLYRILKDYSIGKSLQIGAKVASEVVSVFEPWTTD